MCERTHALKGSHPFYMCKRIMPTLRSLIDGIVGVIGKKNKKVIVRGTEIVGKVRKNRKF